MPGGGRADVLVLEGHCFDLAETPPYGPWIDLIGRYRPDASMALTRLPSSPDTG